MTELSNHGQTEGQAKTIELRKHLLAGPSQGRNLLFKVHDFGYKLHDKRYIRKLSAFLGYFSNLFAGIAIVKTCFFRHIISVYF